MFEQLVESKEKRRKSGRTLVASILVHGAVVLVMLTLPLIHYQQLPDNQFLAYVYAAPPPPPVPPTPVAEVRPVRNSNPVTVLRGFEVPHEIPKGIPEPPEDLPLLSSLGRWGDGGVPTGDPGVAGGFLVGGESVGLASQPLPPPPPPTAKKPVRVGGEVQSAKLIRRVEPIYPPIAIRARVQGSVLLRATIGETGRVIEIKVVQGHPLLRDAALEAVRQWIYSPTLLNGEPVPVVTEISVNFRLTRR